MLKIITLLAGFAVLVSGCAPAPKTVTRNDIDLLATGIASLGPNVDAEEAARAADIAYNYSLQLAEQYNVTDGPIIHNTKVNNGWRERGLCVHWAEDIEARLKQEGFETLTIHRAIAEGNEFRIDHSSAILSARGEDLEQGIVLDPWRNGGLLYWSPTLKDDRYYWEPRMTVLQRKADAESGTIPPGVVVY